MAALLPTDRGQHRDHVSSLACLGLAFMLLKKNLDVTTICGLSFVLYVALVSGVNVWGRFRYLFMPMLIGLAVIGIKESAHIIARWKQTPKLLP